LSIFLCSWYLGHCREEDECSPDQLALQIFVHLFGELGDRAHSEESGVFSPFLIWYSRTFTECQEISILDGRL